MRVRQNLTNACKVLAALLIVSALGTALQRNWGVTCSAFHKMDWRWLGLCVAVATAYRFCNAAGWGLVLRALHHPLPIGTGVHLWLVSETARWLPGSVWGFTSRVAGARNAGVPTAVASMSLALELAFTILAWCLTAVLDGAGFEQFLGRGRDFFPAMHAGDWILVSAVAFGLGIGVAILLRGSRVATKAAGLISTLRRALAARPQPGLLLAALGWYTLLSVLNGFAFYALVRAFSPPQMPGFAAVVGINAVGWLLGFFAVFSPGGLGVREVAITGLLTPLVPLPVAISSALVWRSIQIVVECFCLAVCYLPVRHFLPAARRTKNVEGVEELRAAPAAFTGR